MFLDLAYLVRHELRPVGYLKPEVVGLFFAPARPTRPRPRSAALGNAYAALAELHHFQAQADAVPDDVRQGRGRR